VKTGAVNAATVIIVASILGGGHTKRNLTMPSFQFAVGGKPAPQGSKNAYNRGGRIVLVESSKDLPEYRSWLTACASDAASRQEWVKPGRDTAMEVVIKFVLRKPKSVKREDATAPPDLDKLVRAVLDGITQAGNVWHDDSQVTRLIAFKTYGEAGLTTVTVAY